MLAGMRVAFESMLAEFDPDHLQEQFDRQLESKARCCRCRRKCATGICIANAARKSSGTPRGRFATLFGEEFAKAYEEQFGG